MLLEELMEWGRRGPAYSNRNRGFPGWGQGLFKRAERNYIGWHICDMTDEHIREDLARWFANAFEKDQSPSTNKLFNGEAYVESAVKQNYDAFRGGSPRFQQRHFWYLATLIKDDPDVHRRVFMARWLCNIFTKQNEWFLQSRWEDNCNIPQEYREWKPERRKKGLDHEERSRRVGNDDDE